MANLSPFSWSAKLTGTSLKHKTAVATWRDALGWLLPGGMAAGGALAFELLMRAERWVGAGELAQRGVSGTLPAVYCAALLVSQMFAARQQRPSPEPMLLAVVGTIIVAFIQQAIMVLAMVIAYAHPLLSFGIVAGCVLMLLSIGSALVRRIPLRQAGDCEVRVRLALAALALAGFLLPWHMLQVRMMSAQERGATAAVRFGPLYGVAEQTVRSCAAIRDVTGELHSLSISPRRNVLEDTPYWQSGYFDFDYSGGLGSGRLTLMIEHGKAIAAGNPDGHAPREASWGDRDGKGGVKLFIYPSYADAWVNRRCEFAAESKGQAPGAPPLPSPGI